MLFVNVWYDGDDVFCGVVVVIRLSIGVLFDVVDEDEDDDDEDDEEDVDVYSWYSVGVTVVVGGVVLRRFIDGSGVGVIYEVAVLLLLKY